MNSHRMKWIKKTVWILWILKWTWFISIFPVEGRGVQDTKCYDNCNCCKNTQCHTTYGWTNACSNGCIDRHRGARCYVLCTHDCVSCSDDADKCTECYDGFYPGPTNDCTSECPSNCRNCTSITQCIACKDGYYNENGSTTCPYSLCPGHCKCNGNTCVACKNGFFDTATSCNKTCPPNCMTCSSTEQCNKCDNGFYNGYNLDSNAGQLYRNCTLKCRDACSKCQSYDNCSQCISGKYGNMCDSNCSIGCKDGACHIESGECACSLNFIGNKCNECVNGKYGTFCNKSCPVYCKHNKCSKALGHCSDGCLVNTFVGETCNICRAGTHGELCNKTCHANCKAAKCARNTGVCADGCEGNFNGDFCNTCVPGKYGTKCERNCSVKCANSVCKKDTGNCFSCTDNFNGDNCNACKTGFHGLNCREACSPKCFNGTCGIDSGICEYGCTNNHSGDKCCVQSDNCIECASHTECKKCKLGYFGNLCEDSCPVNCLDACDISTGLCNDCIINHFGPFCNLRCSENCNASRSSSTRNCASSDGKCIFGCKDGFFGFKCEQTCSNFCTDNVCKQEDGICMKGCIGTKDDPACLLSSGKSQDVPYNNSTTPTNIVLGTLLALTTIALCILILKRIIKKIRLAYRKTENSMIQIPCQNLQHRDVTTVSETDSVAYEALNTTRGLQNTHTTQLLQEHKKYHKYELLIYIHENQLSFVIFDQTQFHVHQSNATDES